MSLDACKWAGSKQFRSREVFVHGLDISYQYWLNCAFNATLSIGVVTPIATCPDPMAVPYSNATKRNPFSQARLSLDRAGTAAKTIALYIM